MKYLLLLSLLIGCTKAPVEPKIFKTVEVVGGCDNHGQCGVKFTDGTYVSRAERAVPGMRMCGLYRNSVYETWVSEQMCDYYKGLRK